jgi:hypothetical protein
MNFEDLQISNSCETYILLKIPFLMSSFPGYIVFGRSHQGKIFINKQCVKITYLDYQKLFDCVSGFLAFVAEEKNNTETINFYEKDKESYFWQGISQTVENEEQKFIRFIVQSDSEKNEMVFSLIEFNNFVFVLKRCLLSSLCLKDEEEVIISKLIDRETDFIITCKKSYSIAHDFITDVLKNDQSFLIKKASLIELVRYYNESILILKKLNDIFVQEDDSQNSLSRFVKYAQHIK